MEARRCFSCYKEKTTKAFPIEGMENEAALVFPIIAGGDICGSIIVFKEDKPLPPEELATTLIKISAEFIGKQIED